MDMGIRYIYEYWVYIQVDEVKSVFGEYFLVFFCRKRAYYFLVCSLVYWTAIDRTNNFFLFNFIPKVQAYLCFWCFLFFLFSSPSFCSIFSLLNSKQELSKWKKGMQKRNRVIKKGKMKEKKNKENFLVNYWTYQFGERILFVVYLPEAILPFNIPFRIYFKISFSFYVFRFVYHCCQILSRSDSIRWKYLHVFFYYIRKWFILVSANSGFILLHLSSFLHQ